jgi:hypothetical protein
MLIPHVVQTEADKVFINIYNSQAVALSDGDIVVWNTSSPDGVKTTQPATATLGLVCGVADGTIAASAYGLAQAYGYKAAILITGDATQALVAGDVVMPVAAADHAIFSSGETGGAALGDKGFLYTVEVVASSAAAATYKGFIRCL